MRTVCWFSCGAASAVATKLTLAANPDAIVVRCWVADENPDNDRFAEDCAKWFGAEIVTLKAEKYAGSVDEVIRAQLYISGPRGAPCTVKLKKDVRKAFQEPGDLHVFGYTAEEQKRIDRFIDGNNGIRCSFPLAERGLTHADTLAMVERAGIRLPEMYRLGYHHNNCIGCVKGGAGYWNKVRVDFPAVFEKRAKQERFLNAAMVRIDGKPVFLDELPPDAGAYQKEPEIQCGIFCELAEREIV